MTQNGCSRRWQVEAIRDGRLSGKDLELFERHREQCNDCKADARKLAELKLGLMSLPELPRDPLAVRRSRQQLMAAVNASLLGSSPRRSLGWAAALALLPAAAIAYTSLVRHAPPPAAFDIRKSAVEVRAQPGARWLVHNDSTREQVELSDGQASFKVHPHPNRRVLLLVPDGEIEDLGTTFEVTVREQHTSHIAVTEGRVAVRLANQPEFSLTAGQHWEPPVPASAPAPQPASTPSSVSVASPSASASATARSNAPAVASVPPRSLAKAQSAAAKPVTAPSATLDAASTRAEDTTYLAVVALLRRGRTGEARAGAKAYLLRFPDGFRRIEMLNVATSTDADAPSR